MLAGEGTRLLVIRERVLDLNKTGNRKSLLRHFLAICILFSIFGGLYIHLSRNASPDAALEVRTVLPANQYPPRRSTLSELKQSALNWASADSLTNRTTPFVRTLGPGATNYHWSMFELRAFPSVLSAGQEETAICYLINSDESCIERS